MLTFGIIGLIIYGYIMTPSVSKTSGIYIGRVHDLSTSIISSPVMEPFRRTIFLSSVSGETDEVFNEADEFEAVFKQRWYTKV